LEIHYSPDGGGPSSRQPAPLAEQARDFLTGFLGMNPVPYAPLATSGSARRCRCDATPGYIRFALAVDQRAAGLVRLRGEPPVPDGTEVI
jgi:hypothetical protein